MVRRGRAQTLLSRRSVAMAEALATGRIVWAEVADTNGIGKLRPAVIVTPTERLSPGGSLDVVAINSRLASPLPEDHVMLPWQHQGHFLGGADCRDRHQGGGGNGSRAADGYDLNESGKRVAAARTRRKRCAAGILGYLQHFKCGPSSL